MVEIAGKSTTRGRRRLVSFNNLFVGFLLGFAMGYATFQFVSLYDDCTSLALESHTSEEDGQKQKAQVSTTTTTSLAHHHKMTWNVPKDIQTIRHKECEGGRKTSSTGGFCLTRTKHIGGNSMYDKPLAEYLANNIFAGHSVVDLGAGLGHYGKMFATNGKVQEWIGYDGAMNVQEQTDGRVRFMDLTQPHAADERPCVGADWVLSLEVAEHIPVEYTDAFLRNVRCRAKIGAVISWGRPEQTGGLGHVNTRTEADAIAAVERWGFNVDWDLTNGARAVATLPHFTKTVVVYRLIEPSDDT